MINKIVHISFSSLTPQLAEALYIPHCLKNNIEVEWLDLADIFGFPQNHHAEEYKSIVTRYNNIASLNDYLKILDSLSVLINIQFYFEWRYIKFFKTLKTLKNSPLSTFSMGDIPLYPPLSKTRLKKLLSIRFVIKKLVQAFLFRFYVITGKIKLPLIYFCAAKNRPPFSPSGASFYPINYIDYDRYLRSKDKTIIEKKHITFLDISITTHPDLHFYGINFTDNDRELYRQNLNRFFDFLEKKFSTTVVIAAHPKSNYAPDYFHKRTIIKNDVLNLVASSKLVIGHHSTSTSYAVAYKKPVIFFYDDVMAKNCTERLPVPLLIKTFAKLIQAPCLNISQTYEDMSYLAINNEAYQNFLDSYLIGEGLENQDSANTFFNHLKNLKG